MTALSALCLIFKYSWNYRTTYCAQWKQCEL